LLLLLLLLLLLAPLAVINHHRHQQRRQVIPLLLPSLTPTPWLRSSSTLCQLLLLLLHLLGPSAYYWRQHFMRVSIILHRVSITL
jgi:hypothetical protein